MKYIGILILLFSLAGCAGASSLQELKDQAMLTGDWSAVEKREKIIARRKALQGPSCPSGTVALCQSYIGEKRCVCADRDAIAGALAWR
jgi:hypothetical protein